MADPRLTKVTHSSYKLHAGGMCVGVFDKAITSKTLGSTYSEVRVSNVIQTKWVEKDEGHEESWKTRRKQHRSTYHILHIEVTWGTSGKNSKTRGSFGYCERKKERKERKEKRRKKQMFSRMRDKQKRQTLDTLYNTPPTGRVCSTRST